MGIAKMLAGGLAALAMLCAGAQAQTPVKARHAWIVPGSNIASVLWLKQGVAKHAGKSYAPEAIRYQGTPPMITALAVNEIDVGLLNFS